MSLSVPGEGAVCELRRRVFDRRRRFCQRFVQRGQEGGELGGAAVQRIHRGLELGHIAADRGDLGLQSLRLLGK